MVLHLAIGRMGCARDQRELSSRVSMMSYDTLGWNHEQDVADDGEQDEMSCRGTSSVHGVG